MDANLQFDAAEGTGRAVREETLVLDGAAMARNTATSVHVSVRNCNIRNSPRVL